MSLSLPRELPEQRAIGVHWCRRARLRVTEPRLAIICAALTLSHEGYFDAERLWAEATTHYPRVARATIYRTLSQLCAGGMIRATEFGDGYHRYRVHDPKAPPVVETYVVDCDQVITTPAPFLTWYAEAAAKAAGVTPESYRLQIFARCPRQAGGLPCEICQERKRRGAPPHVHPEGAGAERQGDPGIP